MDIVVDLGRGELSAEKSYGADDACRVLLRENTGCDEIRGIGVHKRRAIGVEMSEDLAVSEATFQLGESSRFGLAPSKRLVLAGKVCKGLDDTRVARDEAAVEVTKT